MWLFCPKCSAQTNAEDKSLYYVYACKSCGHRFRGIHAKYNKVWHTVVRLLTPKWDHPDVTCCIHCGENVRGSGNGSWPSVCGSCGRDLPTTPASNPTPVVSQQSSSTKTPPSKPPLPPPAPAVTQQPVPIKPTAVKASSPPPKQVADFDGCGPCTSCGFIFQMMFNNAVCPKCGKKMSREDAFFSCGSYPHSTPPDNQ